MNLHASSRLSAATPPTPMPARWSSERRVRVVSWLAECVTGHFGSSACACGKGHLPAVGFFGRSTAELQRSVVQARKTEARLGDPPARSKQRQHVEQQTLP